MKNFIFLSAVSALILGAFASQAEARDITNETPAFAKERFQIRGRVIGILADGDGTVDGTNIGTDVDNSYVPELDISYFFTNNISTELVLATAQHTVEEDSQDIGDTWILPPTLMLQYHFQPEKKFSPYVGAGINYSMFYAEDATNGFSDLDVDGGFGWALQAGADYWINDNWGLNLDVKYVDLDVDADVTSGTTRLRASDVELNPIIVGAGVSYRF